MKDNSTRVFGLMCVLVAVWIATYWLYRPPAPPITSDDVPVSMAAANPPATPNTGPMAEVSPPFHPQGSPTIPAQPEQSRRSPPKAESAPKSAPTTPATRVIPPEFWEYTVQKGDGSLEAIAKRLLGDGRLWTKIAEANPLLDARKLIPNRTKLRIPKDLSNIQGKEVVVERPGAPAAASPAAGPPESPSVSSPAAAKTAPMREYVVKDGDTLSGIAKEIYGKSAMWRRIYEANRDVIANPDAVKPGVTLKIPPAE